MLRRCWQNRKTTIDWKKRVEKYGEKAVLHVRNMDKNIDQLTREQFDLVSSFLPTDFPKSLNNILDFGAGAGRFLPFLEQTWGQKPLAFEPNESLRQSILARSYPIVDGTTRGELPIKSSSVDLIWCYKVLGGISDRELKKWTKELVRILQPNGQIVLVENDVKSTHVNHWNYRNLENYRIVFDNISIEKIGSFIEFGDRVNVYLGKK